jgi:hypothetical protein
VVSTAGCHVRALVPQAQSTELPLPAIQARNAAAKLESRLDPYELLRIKLKCLPNDASLT